VPFTLPRDAPDAARLARRAEEVWTPRNERFAEDRALYEVRGRRFRPAQTLDERETVTSNEARAQVQLAQAYLHDADPDLHVALDVERGEDAAQRLEDWCRDKRALWDELHTTGLRLPLVTEEGANLFTLGWLAALTLWNPDPRAGRYPFRFRLLDPTQVYPDPDAREPRYYAYCQDLPVDTLEDEWPRQWWDADAQAYVGGEASQEQALPVHRTVRVTELFTDTERATLVGGKGYLLRPGLHGYGFNPLLCVVAHGAPWRGTPDDRRDDSVTTDRDGALVASAFRGGYSRDRASEWTRGYGVGLIDAIRQAVKDKEEALSMQKLALAKAAVPPTWGQHPAWEEGPDPPRAIGEHVWLPPGATLSPLPPPPEALSGNLQFLQFLQRYIDTAAIGPGGFGAGQATSGFDRTAFAEAAVRLLLLFAEAYRKYLEQCFKRMLRLFARFGQGPSPFLLQNAQGQSTFGPPLDPAEAFGGDQGVQVQFKAVTAGELMQRVNAAALLHREGLASVYYCQTEVLGIANPVADAARRNAERGSQHPAIQEFEALRATRDAAVKDGDGEKAQYCQGLLQALQVKVQQTVQQATAPAPPPAAPPGAPPPGPAGQPPLPGIGVPSQFGPDELLQNAGMPPNGAVLQPAPPGAGMQLA